MATEQWRSSFGGQAGATPNRRSASSVVGSRRSEARTSRLAGSPGGLPFRFPRHPKRGSATGVPRYLRLRCSPLRCLFNFAGRPRPDPALAAAPRSATRSTVGNRRLTVRASSARFSISPRQLGIVPPCERGSISCSPFCSSRPSCWYGFWLQSRATVVEMPVSTRTQARNRKPPQRTRDRP
jgi:hypothetical protein